MVHSCKHIFNYLVGTLYINIKQGIHDLKQIYKFHRFSKSYCFKISSNIQEKIGKIYKYNYICI